jgi:flagellar hook-basal body complex protein FliE
MQIDPLTSAVTMLASPLNLSSGGPAAGGPAGATAPFSSLLQDAMAHLTALENQASSTVEGLLTGTGVDVHAAMIATEKSDLAFETALAVRGKLVSVYQTMMGIQF